MRGMLDPLKCCAKHAILVLLGPPLQSLEPGRAKTANAAWHNKMAARRMLVFISSMAATLSGSGEDYEDSHMKALYEAALEEQDAEDEEAARAIYEAELAAGMSE